MTAANPHMIFTVQRPGLSINDGGDMAKYDSWEAKGLIEEIDVELGTDESSQGVITVADRNTRLIDAFSDATTKAIFRIYMGFGQDLFQPVFKGILASIEHEKGSTIFTNYDMAFVMKLVKKAGYKQKKNDLDIIRELVTRNKMPDGKPLQFHPPATPLKLEPHGSMMQDEQTDWSHVMERAKDAGYHVWVRHDTVFVDVPGKYATPVRTIRPPADNDLLDGWRFIYHTLTDQDGKAEVVSHRRRGHAGKRSQGNSDNKTDAQAAKAEISHLSIKKDMQAPTKSKLSKRAQAQRELEREHAFEGHVETIMPFRGRPEVRQTVAVAGVGKLLSGDYIVEKINYRGAPCRMTMGLDLYRDIG